MPRGTHPIARMMLKGIISREMQDGDGKSLARRKSPPPWSALIRFPGQCPGTDALCWHSPPCPYAAIPAAAAAGAAVTPAAPPSFTAKACPRPSASREENDRKKSPAAAARASRMEGQGELGGVAVHTHACTRTRLCTSACTRTHCPTPTRSPSITAAAPAASFVLPLPPGRARAVPPEPRHSPRSHQPVLPGGQGTERGEARRVRPGGTGSHGIRSAYTPRARQMRLPRHRHGVSGDRPVPSPAGRRLWPRQGPRAGRVLRCRPVGFNPLFSRGLLPPEGQGAAEPLRRAPARAWRSQRRG